MIVKLLDTTPDHSIEHVRALYYPEKKTLQISQL